MTATLIPAGASLVERARDAIAQREEESARTMAERTYSARMSAVAILVAQLESRLGITVEGTTVRLYNDGEEGTKSCAYVEVDGLRFEARAYGELQLARRCTYPYCQRPDDLVRTPIYFLTDLGEALAKNAEHSPYDHNCGVIYEDGEPLTDNQGRPLVRRPPVIPVDREQRAIDDVLAAAEVYAQAVRSVMELEDLRPLLKAKAIGEMLGTPNPLGKPGAMHSASSAEAIVEENSLYWQHRQKQAQAEVEKWRADGALFAAKLRARLAVATVRAGDDE